MGRAVVAASDGAFLEVFNQKRSKTTQVPCRVADEGSEKSRTPKLSCECGSAKQDGQPIRQDLRCPCVRPLGTVFPSGAMSVCPSTRNSRLFNQSIFPVLAIQSHLRNALEARKVFPG